MLNPFAKVYGRLNPEVTQILKNAGWLLVGRVFRMVISLFVSTWIARYLKPDGFGTLQYALAFTSFFTPLSTVQMGPVVTRDLVRKPEASSIILGTGFTLQLIGGFVAAIACILGAFLFTPDQALIHSLVIIVALKFLFNSFQPIENWFEAKVASKFVVFAEHLAFLAIVLLRCALVLWQAPVIAFAIAISLEGLLYSLGLILFYHRNHQHIFAWRTDFNQIKYLIKESFPLLLSSTACVIYISIDQVMLGIMVDHHAVGIYASAATLSEATTFLPVIACSSLYPRIIRSKLEGETIYQQRLQRFYDLNSLLAYGLILGLVPTAGLLITHLYGSSYQEAIAIFRIHIWSSLFAFLGIAQSKWIVAEGLQQFNLYSRLAGLFSNIGLNWLLIPHYGGMGAAIATLISYAIGSCFFFFLVAPTQSNAILMGKSIFLPFRLLNRCLITSKKSL